MDCVTFTTSTSFCANVSSLSCTCKNNIKILLLVKDFLLQKKSIEFACFCSEKIKPWLWSGNHKSRVFHHSENFLNLKLSLERQTTLQFMKFRRYCEEKLRWYKISIFLFKRSFSRIASKIKLQQPVKSSKYEQRIATCL